MEWINRAWQSYICLLIDPKRAMRKLRITGFLRSLGQYPALPRLRVTHTVLPTFDTSARRFSWLCRVGHMIVAAWAYEVLPAVGVAISLWALDRSLIGALAAVLVLILIVNAVRAWWIESYLKKLRRLSHEGWTHLHKDWTPGDYYGPDELDLLCRQCTQEFTEYHSRLDAEIKRHLSHHEYQLFKCAQPQYLPEAFAVFPSPSNEHQIQLGYLAGQLQMLDEAISKRR